METTTSTLTTTPLQQAQAILEKNFNLQVDAVDPADLAKPYGGLVVCRRSGYPRPERTEWEVWEALPPELCDLLEVENVGGGSVLVTEYKP